MEALALILDVGLSKIDYEKNCKLVNKTKRILPPYYTLEAEKLNCRPPGIVSTDEEVVVPLQNLLNHTVSRILEDEDIQQQIDRLSLLNDNEPLLLEFLFKYGSDGTGGMGKFKQSSQNNNKAGKLYASNLVALQLVTYVKGRIYVIYHNTLCNSASSVRPIRHLYAQETTEIIKTENQRLKTEIESLSNFEWTENVSVGFIGFNSMNDQKVVNAINDNNSSQKCPFCLCGMRDFNQIGVIFRADPDALGQLCLSVLHFGIRSVEHIFKVGFNQDFERFHCTAAFKSAKEERKAKICQKFKSLGSCFILDKLFAKTGKIAQICIKRANITGFKRGFIVVLAIGFLNSVSSKIVRCTLPRKDMNPLYSIRSTEQIFDSRPFMYSNIFLKKL